MALNELIEDLGPFLSMSMENKLPAGLAFIKDYPGFIKAMKNISSMTGLETVKDQVARYIKNTIVSGITTGTPRTGQMLHAVIYGPPGCGKTEFGMLLSQLWASMSCLNTPGVMGEKSIACDSIITELNNVRKKIRAKSKKDEERIQARLQSIKMSIKSLGSVGRVNTPKGKFVKVTRGDLVGQYMGHSSEKIRNLAREYSGGVIMIDEAYSLCLSDKDDFGKEVLTEIINLMSSSKSLSFIFAGYKDDIKNTVMKAQPGLERRFSWTFDMNGYTYDELCNIFFSQMLGLRMRLEDGIREEAQRLFNTHGGLFKNQGGDTKRLADKVKETLHTRLWLRVRKGEDVRKGMTVTWDVIKEAFDMYKKSRDNCTDISPYNHMYS